MFFEYNITKYFFMDTKRIFWTSVLVLAVGILLLCYRLPGLDFLVSCLGWLFIAAAVLNLIMQFVRAGKVDKQTGHTGHTSVLSMLTAIASGALGLWMVLAPGGFVTAMVYILGAMMILSGVYLIYTMLFGFRPIRFPFGFYILPSLVTICGIVICCMSPVEIQNSIVMITAIAMIVLSIGAMIEVAGVASFRRASAVRMSETETTSTGEPAKVEEVHAEDVTESSWPSDKKSE